MSDRDSVFFRNFTIFSAVLTVLAIILILIGRSVHYSSVGDHSDQVDRSVVQSNIQPVATVNTDPNAVAAAPVVAGGAEAPFDGSVDGQLIYDNVCMACHTTGAGGSPTLVKSQWDSRMEQGIETLYKHAIEGYTGSAGLMPAKGGRTDLTDEQVQAAVDYIVSHIQ
ncbi:c-type cytochrome [Marinicella gelatinilytica]|uniref:c-type cytochrome n=1 Tax=Marinicella gelatinilytica TaxID=2996017 RepID=UPI002260F077|nr:c-type cytochrome [Marinicella gelatinilytica]MCX7544031.1 c-type cytochrome [Marinicella gelatinilytica]